MLTNFIKYFINIFAISYKKTRIFFLIYDTEIEFNTQLERLIKKNVFFNNITNVNERKSYDHFIKIDDFKTYGSFIDSIAEFCAEKEKSYTIYSVERNFKYIEIWENSNCFINLMTNKNDWKAV